MSFFSDLLNQVQGNKTVQRFIQPQVNFLQRQIPQVQQNFQQQKLQPDRNISHPFNIDPIPLQRYYPKPNPVQMFQNEQLQQGVSPYGFQSKQLPMNKQVNTVDPQKGSFFNMNDENNYWQYSPIPNFMPNPINNLKYLNDQRNAYQKWLPGYNSTHNDFSIPSLKPDSMTKGYFKT